MASSRLFSCGKLALVEVDHILPCPMMSAATTISGQPRLFDALMHPAHISGIHSSDDGVFLSILLQEAQSSYLISPLIHNPQGLLPFIGYRFYVIAIMPWALEH
ncbi:uncharacterized protein CIMG_01898 [Coccidioides immitis RS]|uniref:Uncharacterized protein n=1 Tax=Coccidioides immitis (strain RS) TaxID=246410 RepID=J3KK69_COCIM|nr:uncharacterized protein CIMG_01898 [Coccidioides immitis RS]EAS36544.3 hypothetical protein CIMG_01898 [Coccidioides immitis RS]